MTDDRNRPAPLSEEYLLTHTIGELKPLAAPILIAAYDPAWPDKFQHEAENIRSALAGRALRIEHVGSTSVPGLPAKPVIDILLVVAGSADEKEYAPVLEAAGYHLQIREPDWYEHRMFVTAEKDVNLHVLSVGCPEVSRMLVFRDWLRTNEADRELYAEAKQTLARQEWKYTQNYADAKTSVIEEILSRARTRGEVAG